MSENDFETRQMCRSPQCVSQHHLGLEAGCPRRCILELFRTRANFFSLLCLVELLLLLLLLLLQLGQNPAQFLRDIWLMLPNQKRGLYWSSVLILWCELFTEKRPFYVDFETHIFCFEVPKNDKRVQLFRIISALFCIVFAAALLLQILLMCNLMYIRRQTEMCCAHVLNMLKLTDHG